MARDPARGPYKAIGAALGPGGQTAKALWSIREFAPPRAALAGGPQKATRGPQDGRRAAIGHATAKTEAYKAH